MIDAKTKASATAFIIAALLGCWTAIAAEFPERPVRLIVGTSPGGGTDAIARLFSKALYSKWNRSVVVDNRPGADGMIGMDVVAKANPDGYTLGICNANHTIRPNFNKNQPFDTVESFTTIVLLASSPDVLVVNPTYSTHATLQELVATAKAKPRQLRYSSAGYGTPPSLEIANFAQRVGIEMLEVTYKGSGPAVVALLAGEVHLNFAALVGVLGHVKAGRLRALGSGSKVRHPLMPDVPTIAEAANLPGFEAANWYGIVGPARLPAKVTQRLHEDFLAVIKTPEIAESLHKQGFLINTLNPAEFQQFLKSEVRRWAETAKGLPPR